MNRRRFFGMIAGVAATIALPPIEATKPVARWSFTVTPEGRIVDMVNCRKTDHGTIESTLK